MNTEKSIGLQFLDGINYDNNTLSFNGKIYELVEEPSFKMWPECCECAIEKYCKDSEVEPCEILAGLRNPSHFKLKTNENETASCYEKEMVRYDRIRSEK